MKNIIIKVERGKGRSLFAKKQETKTGKPSVTKKKTPQASNALVCTNGRGRPSYYMLIRSNSETRKKKKKKKKPKEKRKEQKK